MRSDSLERVERLMERYELRKTPLKKEIVRALLQAKAPLSQGGLIQALSKSLEKVDRVSVYRNLNQMKEVGLIHEVDVNSYVCCSHDCGEHPHLLFFCEACGRHQEIKDHKRIETLMAVLADFRFFGQGQPLLLKSICETCA